MVSPFGQREIILTERPMRLILSALTVTMAAGDEKTRSCHIHDLSLFTSSDYCTRFYRAESHLYDCS